MGYAGICACTINFFFYYLLLKIFLSDWLIVEILFYVGIGLEGATGDMPVY